MKEKKPTMTEALSNTLQAMHKAGCLTLADIVEGRHYTSSKLKPFMENMLYSSYVFISHRFMSMFLQQMLKQLLKIKFHLCVH